MNYIEVLDQANKSLKLEKIRNFRLDSELILSKVLNKTREEILINLKNKINNKKIDQFNLDLFRRLKKEPMAYILGFKHFWKYKFFVNKSVMIPRPETEHLIEEALKYIPIGKSINILDIGTGSGCIIISILKERIKCHASAIDISNKALKVAKINAKLHHLENKIKFINIDIDKYNSNKYDLILSNPPYISYVDLVRLDDEVRQFEPKLALSGGLNGYKVISKAIIKGSKLLKNNGKLIIEIGKNQKNKSVDLLKKNGFYINNICKDFSGNNRCIISTKINK
tara:strand:+ start:89 stop:937 length:849 start_codon:yes stop_codon:yes gene_type:complete